MEGVVIADGRMTRPNGASLTGHLGVIAASLAGSFARFRATHHVSSDHIIDLDGDNARTRANLIAMYLWAATERDPSPCSPTSSPTGYSTPSQHAPARDGASAKCPCATPWVRGSPVLGNKRSL